MSWVNCTPHDVHIYKGSEIIATVPSNNETIIRLESKHQKLLENTDINGATVEVYEPQEFTNVVGLPSCTTGCSECPNIIVSMPVAEYLRKSFVAGEGTIYRGKVYTPDTNKFAVRENGRIVGTRALNRWY